MALLYNLARMTTTTTGTGTITLGVAVSGFLTFAQAGVQNGDVIAYSIRDGSNSEDGTGTYTSSGTTLTRTVTKSTNSDSAINLSGSAQVIISPRKEDILDLTNSNSLKTSGLSTSAPPIGFCAPLNCAFAVSAAASALTIALKDAAGNDPSTTSPVLLPFRNSAAGTGGPLGYLAVTAATSLVISSGSTLGISNAVGFKLWIVGFNDSGTFRLGVMNASNQGAYYPMQNFLRAASTAEGGAGGADSAKVFYTGTAVASAPYTIIGYADWNSSGLATAGTWTTTNLGTLQVYGPGIPLPGTIMQRVIATTGTETDVTSTTFVDTALSATISPTMASNDLYISVTGGCLFVNTASAT